MSFHLCNARNGKTIDIDATAKAYFEKANPDNENYTLEFAKRFVKSVYYKPYQMFKSIEDVDAYIAKVNIEELDIDDQDLIDALWANKDSIEELSGEMNAAKEAEKDNKTLEKYIRKFQKQKAKEDAKAIKKAKSGASRSQDAPLLVL